MKPGIRIGQTWSFDITVIEAMQAQFEDTPVHPLYATAAMLTHMEWAARQHILPVLEAGEEGVGCHMEVDHLHPTPLGAVVKITAMVTGLKPGKVICLCEAYHGNIRVGRATVVQAILPLARLHDRIACEVT